MDYIVLSNFGMVSLQPVRVNFICFWILVDTRLFELSPHQNYQVKGFSENMTPIYLWIDLYQVGPSRLI